MPWLMISARKRWCLYWIVDGMFMQRVWHTERALDKPSDKLTGPSAVALAPGESPIGAGGPVTSHRRKSHQHRLGPRADDGYRGVFLQYRWDDGTRASLRRVNLALYAAIPGGGTRLPSDLS